MGRYTLGFDFGTLSVRAMLLDVDRNVQAASAVSEYPHGVMETDLPAGWALQDPMDYLNCMETVSKTVLQLAGAEPEEVLGIGLDFTSSTVLPVNADGTPLCCVAEFAKEPHAFVKLWKHHGAEPEAVELDRAAREQRVCWLDLYGGKVSSEWMLPKVLETARHAPQVYEAADRFLEALDWVTWQLTGEVTRSSCAAGYKSFYHHQNGYPADCFLTAVEPAWADLVSQKLRGPIKAPGEAAGVLCDAMAQRLGLCSGIPVGIGMIDAHASVLGSGISEPGTMMIIVGTSSCHMLLSEKEAGIPGVAGVVRDGIVPGYFAYEAGQSCVGDLYAWFVRNCVPEAYETEAREKGIGVHELLTEKLAGYRPGKSGLLALDWHNGVRSPLMDFDLSGLILGMNLQTKPEEIYLSLIEATAYGTRMILESFESAGVPVKRIVMSGGIPLKNPLLVQVYADVCNREIAVSSSTNASVRGAALLGLAAGGTHGSVKDLVKEFAEPWELVYRPNQEHAAVYDVLYREYRTLHRYFGTGENDVMKRLNALRSAQ